MVRGFLLFAAGVSLGLLAPTLMHQTEQGPVQTIGDFPDLGKGLTETPGCLGVQSFAVNAGKTQVISAWFKNRAAMEAWYYGKMHQDAMAKFFPGLSSDHKPFASFTDTKAPILIVASVTPGTKPLGQGSNLAVSQIAIEGYTPIPGGLAIGGTFAPANLEVPHLVRLPAGK